MIPNAGLPRNVRTESRSTRWDRTTWPAELAEFVREFGAPIVGGCCGTTPEHIAALVEAVALGGARAAPGRVRPRAGQRHDAVDASTSSPSRC